MARVFSPRILLVATLYVIIHIHGEEHCETRDIRTLLQHVRQLEKEFKDFTATTFEELKELKSTMEQKLDELRKMIQQTTTTAMTTPSSVSSSPSLTSAPSLTSTPTPVSTTTENSACPEGWERNGSSCYYIEKSYIIFDDAQEFYKNRSANLVHVNNATENDFLKSLMEKSGSYYFWIGLKYNVSEWRWIDDGTVAGFTDWGPGEPASVGAQGCCRAWRLDSYRWEDYPCSYNIAYPLCEKVLS